MPHVDLASLPEEIPAMRRARCDKPDTIWRGAHTVFVRMQDDVW